MDSLLERREPTWIGRFFQDPLRTLAKSLYQLRQRRIVSATSTESQVTVVCISDTHNNLPDLPAGDILIHAGDLSQAGTSTEIQATLDWLARQDHPHKIVIAGNHELLLDPNYDSAKEVVKAKERSMLDWHDLTYLQDEELVLRMPGGRRVKFYGCPWTRKHGNWAFQYQPGADKWSGAVPDDVDVLITHMPPFAHQDIDGWGDEYLLKEVKRTRPKLHVFGHFHGGRGIDNTSFTAFEAAFEEVMRRRNVLWSFGKMCCLGFLDFFRGSSKPVTAMVNAAMLGVSRDRFKDDQVFEAQVVHI